MCVRRFALDVHVHLHISPDLVFEYFVDRSLVCCFYILQYEGHDLVEVHASVDNEGGMLPILRDHPNLIVTRVSVHESEEFMP